MANDKWKGKAKEIEGVIRDDEAKKREGQTQKEAAKAGERTTERRKNAGSGGLLPKL